VKSIDLNLVTTAFELPGQRIVRNVGVVRGIVVRSRSLVGSIGAGLQTLLGGNEATGVASRQRIARSDEEERPRE
jgi:uncharacterized protein YbjQ (UPF0145 family)